LSRVHPKYFRSFNKRYSTSFSLRAEWIICCSLFSSLRKSKMIR
jgi:hypothetical protein